MQAANGLQESAPLLSEVEVNESEYPINEQESHEGFSRKDSHDSSSHKDSHEGLSHKESQASYDGLSHKETQASYEGSFDKEFQASRAVDEQVVCCKFLRRVILFLSEYRFLNPVICT